MRLGFVIPVSEMATAVTFWADVLGVEPTFVDGTRWAQFDHEGTRLSLAGDDSVTDEPAVMVKVNDPGAVAGRMRAAGCRVSPTTDGPHETRVVVTAPGGTPVIFYAPR